MPEQPADVLMDAMHYAKQLIASGNVVKNEELLDIAAYVGMHFNQRFASESAA